MSSSRGDSARRKAIALTCGENCPVSVLDQLPQGIFWKDLQLRYLGCNRSFLDSMGLSSPDQLLGKTDRQLLKADTARRFEKADQRVLSTGEQQEYVYPERREEGVVRWVETVKKPLLDADGRTIGILGLSQDVTRRIQGKMALEESEKLNRAVMEHAPIGISIREASGRLLYANKAWRKIWNLTRQQVAEDMATPRSFFSFDDTDSYLGPWMGDVRRIYSEGGQLKIPELHVDTPPRQGTAEWLSHYYYAIRGPEGDVSRIVVLTEDITARKRNQRAARETAEQYRALTSNLPVGIFRYGIRHEKSLVRVNPALVRMFGLQGPEELVGSDLHRLFASEEDCRKLREELERSGAADNREILLRRADGSTFWGSVSARAVEGSDDRLAYVDGTVSDVTRRKTATEKLQASLERLGRMTDSTVSAMSLLVDQRDPYTAGHQRQVAQLAGAIARDMGLSEDTVRCVRTAAMLHDIGKMCVPSEILTKPGSISDMEYNLIKSHPRVGADILGTIDFPWPVAEVVLQHHERLNGTGYPDGLMGAEIRLESRIIAVADVVDAMSSHRPYRPAVGTDAALDLVERSAGSLFDPEVVRSCLRLFRQEGFTLASYGPSLSSDPMDHLRRD